MKLFTEAEEQGGGENSVPGIYGKNCPDSPGREKLVLTTLEVQKNVWESVSGRFSVRRAARSGMVPEMGDL